MRPHEKLDVWQLSITLIEKVYKLVRKYPKEEIFGLVSQMRRSAVSIACNIAEGAARQTKGEFRQFLFMARGSLSELETQIIISFRLSYTTDKEYKEMTDLSDRVGRMITGLISKLT